MAIYRFGIFAACLITLSAQPPVAVRTPIPAPPTTQNTSAPGTGRIEGRVISIAGDPLRKATVRLQMLNTPRPAAAPAAPATPGMPMQMPMQVTMSSYSCTTDNDGGFVFEDVDAARYTLSAERNGFVRATYGAKGQDSQSSQLVLSAGQSMTGVVLKMTPQAMIGGKVTDEDGDPLPNAQVQLYRMAWSQGRRQLQPINNSSTLPDGSFLMANLVAGKYYLGATNTQAMRMGGRDRPGRKGPQEDYVTTYYPSAIDSAQAAPIEVTAGIDVRGIEIRMRKTRVFRIVGRAVHSSGASTQGAQLTLQPLAGGNMFGMGRAQAMVRDQGGLFEFNNVLPGAYVLQTQPGAVFRGPGAMNTAPVPMLGRMHVSVGGQDLNDVIITLGPGADLSGQFVLEGAGPLNADARAKLTGAAATSTPTNNSPANRVGPGGGGRLPMIQLMVAEGANFGQSNNQAKDDGSFVMKNIQPDRYRLSATGLPEGCYAKQIRFGGQDVTRSVVDLTSGAGGQIEIVVSPKAAQVNGVVRNAKGETAKDTMLTLWQSVDETGAPEFIRSFRTDENGSFRFTSLAPGEYRIAAWEQVDGGLVSNPDFRKQFESSAVTVKLQENSRENVEVKVIPFDA
ncbi:MAG TPA: carboxypeptidase regulatory-like domain-containing protein, partial [Bryobacteraceae bacterium]|nr:carboxypeptidase regulatory-like domain-containing protein [Bryobacteraceae bacterium]